LLSGRNTSTVPLMVNVPLVVTPLAATQVDCRRSEEALLLSHRVQGVDSVLCDEAAAVRVATQLPAAGQHSGVTRLVAPDLVAGGYGYRFWSSVLATVGTVSPARLRRRVLARTSSFNGRLQSCRGIAGWAVVCSGEDQAV